MNPASCSIAASRAAGAARHATSAGWGGPEGAPGHFGPWKTWQEQSLENVVDVDGINMYKTCLGVQKDAKRK